ncbi:MAG: hypothetical protein JXD22_01880 [Sedimentisphaerales bacterium]|nr:hypothetical protein [Sedimentisphaerales bacterium]
MKIPICIKIISVFMAMIISSSCLSGIAQTPLISNVKDSDIPVETLPLIKPWKVISLDPTYRGQWIVTGDVDGDGIADIVSARNVNKGDIHYTCSVVAHRLDGSIIWKWGNPEIGRASLHHDVACQIYDWNGDGKNEVIVAADKYLIEIDGTTGKEKHRFAIPPESSDCIVLCNLSGNKFPSDILVKTRYTQIWAYNYSGKQLWTAKNPGGCKTAHQPRPIDIDGDGKDEIMAGYALLNPDGSMQWPLEDNKHYGGHLDCARIFQKDADPSKFSMILTFCGGNRIAKINGQGKMLWTVTGRHFESVNIGKLRKDLPGKQIVVDIDHEQSKGKGPLWILDENGKFLAEINTPSSRHHLLIDWFGQGLESIIIGRSRTMYDGYGKPVAVFAVDQPSANYICSKGDMDGDGIRDVILFSSSTVYIYQNKNGKKPANKIPLGCGVNFTLY